MRIIYHTGRWLTPWLVGFHSSVKTHDLLVHIIVASVICFWMPYVNECPSNAHHGLAVHSGSWLLTFCCEGAQNGVHHCAQVVNRWGIQCWHMCKFQPKLIYLIISHVPFLWTWALSDCFWEPGKRTFQWLWDNWVLSARFIWTWVNF